MPLEFIPNQPIIFEKPIGDFPCLNNDTKTYGQLLQDGDDLCIQWKLGACDEPLCEPDMVMDPIGADELGAWSVNGGFTSASSSEVSYVGPDVLPQTAGQSLALTVGASYIFSGQVDVYTGGKDFTVLLGSSVVQIGNIPESGQFSIGFTAYETPITIAILSDPGTSAGDTLQLSGLQLKQHTTCWVDDLNGGLPSWSYSFDGANGKFCSFDPDGGDLINTTAFTTTGNYHGVELTISDCTVGGIEVYLGSVLLGTTSGNGQFSFYGVPTAGTDLVFTKVDLFDGCVSQVTVSDYGLITDYKIHFETDSGNVFSADYTGTAYEDRLLFCNKLSDLTWTVNGMPDGALLCELLKTFIYDPCDDVEHESVNYINYKNDGWECTKMVESWNDGFAFGLYFGDIANPDFVLRQRLRFLAFNPVYRNAGEEYLYSSGNTGRSFAQSQKARTAWFDYMDEYAHDCTRTQLLGQKLLVDGYAFYFPTEDYEPEWNERGAYNLAQSRVTLFHEEAIFGSTCGTMANTVCPPQVTPSPVQSYSQIQVKATITSGGFDFTAVSFQANPVDSAGTFIVTTCSNNVYDLTDAGGRAALLTDLICYVDQVFSTTSSGTITYTAPSTIEIDITGSISLSAPAPVLTFALYDSACNYPLPFATIPS